MSMTIHELLTSQRALVVSGYETGALASAEKVGVPATGKQWTLLWVTAVKGSAVADGDLIFRDAVAGTIICRIPAGFNGPIPMGAANFGADKKIFLETTPAGVHWWAFVYGRLDNVKAV